MNTPFVSYGQNNEDVLLRQALRDALAAQPALAFSPRGFVPSNQSRAFARLDRISEEIQNVRAQLEFPWIERLW